MAAENDLVLIYLEDNPMVFARIESILTDSKPDWYHVKLLMLQVPPQTVTWILRDVYIDGQEFTMNGKRVRLEKVEAPAEPEAEADPEDAATVTPENGRTNVISLADLKKT
ncbi:MAG: hypothetical protein QNJ04_13520 [Desulfobacterales bacterium]|nr:hypothetical protein [Desulfobacterales bacterium]